MSNDGNVRHLAECGFCKSRYFGSVRICPKCGGSLATLETPKDFGQPLRSTPSRTEAHKFSLKSPTLEGFLELEAVEKEKFESELMRLILTPGSNSSLRQVENYGSLSRLWLTDSRAAQRLAHGILRNIFGAKSNPRVWNLILTHECSLLTYSDSGGKYSPERLAHDIVRSTEAQEQLQGKTAGDKMASLKLLYFQDFSTFRNILAGIASSALDPRTVYKPGVGDEVKIIYTAHPHY